MTTGELTLRIKEKARLLGFDAVGIAPASAAPGTYLREWLANDFHGEMAYLERNADKRMSPDGALDDVQSIISVALNYFHPYQLPYEQPRRGVVSRYAAGDDYHEVMEKKLSQLLDAIRALAPQAEGRVYVDTGPVMDKHWAAQSGIGWLGKHTNVLSRRAGSWFFLGEVLLDLELEYDVAETDHCGSCTRCLEVCPTDAFVEPYVLDSRRCISYLTIELKEDIPEEFRGLMGNLVFGCDLCQDVCPWNRKAPLSSVGEFSPREINRAPDLVHLSELSSHDFSRQYKGSPIKRAKWRGFLRNVAVAMGNSRDPALVPALRRLLQNGDPMVRRHAAWALNRIATRDALQAIRRRIAAERDEATLAVLGKILDENPGNLDQSTQ